MTEFDKRHTDRGFEDRTKTIDRQFQRPVPLSADPRLYKTKEYYAQVCLDALVRVTNALYQDRFDFPQAGQAGKKVSMITAATVAMKAHGAEWVPPKPTTHTPTAETPDASIDMNLSAKTYRDAKEVISHLHQSNSLPDGIEPTAFEQLDVFLTEQIERSKARMDLLRGGRAVPRQERSWEEIQEESRQIEKEAEAKGLHELRPMSYAVIDDVKIVKYSFNGPLLRYLDVAQKKRGGTNFSHVVTIRQKRGEKLPKVYGAKYRSNRSSHNGEMLIDGRGGTIPAIEVDSIKLVQIRNADLDSVVVTDGEVDIRDANVGELKLDGKSYTQGWNNPHASVYRSSVGKIHLLGTGAKVYMESSCVVSAVTHQGMLLGADTDYGSLVADDAQVSVRGDIGTLTSHSSYSIGIDGSVGDVQIYGSEGIVGISEPVERMNVTGDTRVVYRFEKDQEYREGAHTESEVAVLATSDIHRMSELPPALQTRRRNDSLERLIHNASGVVSGEVLGSLVRIMHDRDRTRNVSDLTVGQYTQFSEDGHAMIAGVRDSDLRLVLQVVDEYETASPTEHVDIQAVRDFIGRQRYYQLEKLTRLVKGEEFAPKERGYEAQRAASAATERQIKEGGYKLITPSIVSLDSNNDGDLFQASFYKLISKERDEDGNVRHKGSWIDIKVPLGKKTPSVYRGKDGIILIDGQGASVQELDVTACDGVTIKSLDVVKLKASRTNVTIDDTHVGNVRGFNSLIHINNGKVYRGEVFGESGGLFGDNTDMGTVVVGRNNELYVIGDIGSVKAEKFTSTCVTGDIGILDVSAGVPVWTEGEIGKIVRERKVITDLYRDVVPIIDPLKRLPVISQPEEVAVQEQSGAWHIPNTNQESGRQETPEGRGGNVYFAGNGGETMEFGTNNQHTTENPDGRDGR